MHYVKYTESPRPTGSSYASPILRLTLGSERSGTRSSQPSQKFHQPACDEMLTEGLVTSGGLGELFLAARIRRTRANVPGRTWNPVTPDPVRQGTQLQFRSNLK